MSHRVIYREKPKEDVFKSLIQEFYRENPKADAATIIIEEGKPKRSDAQSRLYFSWRDILADHIGETKSRTHKLLKDKFINGESTKELNVMEFIDYLLEIEDLAAEYEVKLPHNSDFNLAIYGK